MDQGSRRLNFGRRPVSAVALEAYVEAARDGGFDAERMRDAETPLRTLAGVGPSDLFFALGSGAEAMHQVLFSIFWEVSRTAGKCHFLISCLEDAATCLMCKRLEELGCVIQVVPVDRTGQIDREALERLINPRTALFSLSYAQELTGVVQPIEEIGEICQRKGVRLHLDVSDAVGKIPLRFVEWGLDYLTFSGRALFSVDSSAALFVRPTAPSIPWIFGRELDIPSLWALSRAAQQSLLFLDTVSLECARLRDLFEQEVTAKIAGAEPLFREGPRLPTSSLIRFPSVHQEALQHRLQRQKLDTFLGGNAKQKLSALLRASGASESESESALTFSFSRYTLQTEVEQALTILPSIVAALRVLTEAL